MMDCRALIRVALAVPTALSLPVTAVAEMASGCYLPMKEGVVVGINRNLKSIQLPMGSVEVGESLEETAARETLEETGIRVTVGRQLLTLKEGTIALYFCSPAEPVTDYAALVAGDTYEIGEILVLDPHTMRNYDGRTIAAPWRHPPVRFLLRALFAPTASSAND